MPMSIPRTAGKNRLLLLQVTRSSRKHTKKPTDQLPSDEDIAHLKDMRLRSESLNFTDSEISATPFTKWSQWSRCQDCFQLRIKQCVGVKCKDSKIYEERPCEKKRCKRKTRQKENFRIVQLKQVWNEVLCRFMYKRLKPYKAFYAIRYLKEDDSFLLAAAYCFIFNE